VEKVEENTLIETLKKLIQNDEALTRQMKRTIAMVDRKLREHGELDSVTFSESGSDSK